MQNNIMFVAGMQQKAFQVFRPADSLDGKGRPIKGELTQIGEISGSIAVATEREVMRHKQTGHDVTHVVVTRGRAEVKAEDVLILDGWNYRVYAAEDPGLLGLYTVITCERKGG